MNDYDDDDDDDEEEEEDDDDNHHQGMGCHRSALCLQRQVDKKSFLFYPVVFFARLGFKCVRERGRLVTKVKFL